MKSIFGVISSGLVAAASSVLFCTSSLAAGPGYNVNSFAGTAPTQYHVNNFQLDICGGSCAAGGGHVGGEVVIINSVDYANGGLDSNYDCSDAANTPSTMLYEFYTPATTGSVTDLAATGSVVACDITVNLLSLIHI